MKKITLFIIALFITSMSFGQMSGTYKVGTSEVSPNFTTLKAACDAINATPIIGNVILEITSNLTETANFGLANNTTYSITIRPDVDAPRVITFTQAGDNGASSGNFIIGLPNVNDWNSIGTTKNITIDGYSDGGSIRQLTFANQAANANTCKPIHMVGNLDNIVVKNCILTDNTNGTSAFGVVSIRVRNASSVDYIPKNITVDNCVITSVSQYAAGVFVSNSGTPVGRPTGLVFSKNDITVKHRGLSLNYAGTSSTINNIIKVNQTYVNMASFAIGGTGGGGMVSTTISGNKIIQLATANIAGGANGIRAIQTSGGGDWFIYNNFISGFETPATGTTEVLGIRVGSKSFINNNTIVLNNVTTTGIGTTPSACIVTYSATSEFKNNILISNEDDFKTYCMYGKAISDYNNMFLSGITNSKVGYASADYTTLADWQLGSSQDANSKSKAVNFVSATDLSLTGTSIDDVDITVPAIGAPVSADIFGNARHTPKVYMGAHEPNNINDTQTFTVTAPQGTEHVYIVGSFIGKSWDINTPFELTATANPYEFSGTFPAHSTIQYKYLCQTGNWDYQEATSVSPLTAANDHAYAANDVVAYWKAMPKIKLNVSIATGGVPSKLYVKGGWDSWATPVELTASSIPLSVSGQKVKSGATVSYTGTIGNGTTDVIYANTEYKYYTSDLTDPNWEANADGSSKSNRWSIYPLMNDEIARFTTQIATAVNLAKDIKVVIMRTPSGIAATFDGNAVVELYSINGALIEKTKANGTYSRDLSHGAYVIRINGKSTKFIK